jgi:hypothetical protein
MFVLFDPVLNITYKSPSHAYLYALITKMLRILVHMYLFKMTDVTFYVSYLARVMSNLIEDYYNYALQIVDYLYTYKDLVMGFKAPLDSSALWIDNFSKTSPH